ncbi:hypothetical protein Pcinc_041272, partial [Petrolisthes cinctipes]
QLKTPQSDLSRHNTCPDLPFRCHGVPQHGSTRLAGWPDSGESFNKLKVH